MNLTYDLLFANSLPSAFFSINGNWKSQNRFVAGWCCPIFFVIKILAVPLLTKNTNDYFKVVAQCMYKPFISIVSYSNEYNWHNVESIIQLFLLLYARNWTITDKKQLDEAGASRRKCPSCTLHLFFVELFVLNWASKLCVNDVVNHNNM